MCLESDSIHRTSHQSTQHNMAVRLKACGYVTMGGGLTAQRATLRWKVIACALCLYATLQTPSKSSPTVNPADDEAFDE